MNSGGEKIMGDCENEGGYVKEGKEGI